MCIRDSPSTSEVEEYKLKELFEKDAASNGGARTYFQWDPAKGREDVYKRQV